MNWLHVKYSETRSLSTHGCFAGADRQEWRIHELVTESWGLTQLPNEAPLVFYTIMSHVHKCLLRSAWAVVVF